MRADPLGGDKMRRSETKILVVDDEQQVRDLFCESLGEAGQTCFSAAGGKEALGILAKEDIDLVIIDIIMPGMSGLSLFEHIKDRHPDVAAIFVTAMDDVNIAVSNLKHGAYDYLLKPVTLRRLKQAVDEVLEKREKLQQASTDVARNRSAQSVMTPLSQREMELLQELGRGRSNKDISHALNITTQTVKNHITSIFRKLDVDDRTQAVLSGLRNGWIILEERAEPDQIVRTPVTNRV